MPPSVSRVLALGILAGLAVIALLAGFFALGAWSWTHPWRALPTVLGGMGAVGWVLPRLLPRVRRCSEREQTWAAGLAAAVGTVALQTWAWTQQPMVEEFRRYAMIMGTRFTQGQLEVNRILASMALACLLTGVALLALEAARQRRWLPQALNHRLAMPTACFLLAFLAATLLAGRTWSMMALA